MSKAVSTGSSPTSVNEKAKHLLDRIDTDRIPTHIAIIMDGNGRWAKSRGLNRIAGHTEGIKSVRDTVTTCRELGVKVLTLYALSKENLNRPPAEISALMDLLKTYLKDEINEMRDNDIRLDAIGDIADLRQDVQEQLKITKRETAGSEKMLLNLALSYSGRAEITQAVKAAIEKVANGEEEEITEDLISSCLGTAGYPDPDLLIRTSGEFRISNFLLWQAAYSEIYITDTLWPDFRGNDLYLAVLDFQRRERRFGLTSEQVSGKKFSIKQGGRG